MGLGARAVDIDIDAVIAEAARNGTKTVVAAKTIKASMILSKNKVLGRPDKFSEAKARFICKQLSEGKTITSICKEIGVHVESVYRWIDKNEIFREDYNRSKRNQAVSLINDLVDEFKTNLTNDNALAARTKSDLYRWIAARQAPSEFGEVKRVELKGEITHTHIHELADHQKRKIAEAWLMSQSEDSPRITSETTGPDLPALESVAVREICEGDQGIVPKRKRSAPALVGPKGKGKGKHPKPDLEAD